MSYCCCRQVEDHRFADVTVIFYVSHGRSHLLELSKDKEILIVVELYQILVAYNDSKLGKEQKLNTDFGNH